MKKHTFFILLISLFIFASCSESNNTSPQDQGNDPQNPGNDPQNPGNDPQNPGNDPQNPGNDPQNPGNNPTVNPTDQGFCKPDPNPNYPNLVTDEDWARAVISGTVPPDIAFPTIAFSCGFPVYTHDDTVLFIHWYYGESWQIAGDLTDWKPVQMNTTNNGNVQSIELKQPSDPTKIKYKFVKNNQNYQSDPWSLRFNYDENGEFSYLTAPKSQQYLMRWHTFESPQGLKRRSIYVLVPPNDGPYDVIYAQDGQNLFQANGYSGGWKLRENMTQIHGNFLIVGISNSDDRMNEYTHVSDTVDNQYYESKGNAYAKFVEESVRPFIEYKFKTTSKAGLMGSSLGGLISLYIAHLYPNRYRAVLALSPTTAWGRFGSNDGTTIKDLYVNAGHRSTYLYFDNGGKAPNGGCPDMLGHNDAYIDEADGANTHDNYCYTRDFRLSMEKIGYQYDIDMTHWHQPEAKHNEEAWAERVNKPLTLFMNLK